MTETRSRFHIHASNRLEILADRLADEMARRPGDPLAPERIVVPHPLLGRWLRLALASRLGIAAHLRIELPAEFAWSAMREAMPGLPEEQPFSPSRLRWRIFEKLTPDASPRSPAARQEDDQLHDYLADGDPRKRFELATRLAHIYDRCLLYRPAWIRAWQAGETPHWQARLWRQLFAPDGDQHWVSAIDAYRRRMSALGTDGPPADASATQLELAFDQRRRGRASFFAVAGLSPSYLEWLRSAATQTDIHLFLLSPCREFWADIRAPHGAQRADADDAPPLGNELLAAWGKAPRDLQALLADDLGTGAPDEIYAEPAGDSQLAALQADILKLRTIGEGRAAQPAELGRADDSVQIHVCHSATREAEVLHDRLLGLFDADADIEPADVLVLTPNLDEYAPAIESVFSAAGVIPFNIARQRRRDSAALQAFLDLLALPDSRYGIHAMLAPLRAASVRATFAIDESELATLGDWLHGAGIRWGIDADQLREEGVQAASHTWQAGLRRLLLGYAMAAPQRQHPTATLRKAAPVSRAPPVFAGEVPLSIGDAHGSDIGDYERLGRFARYCELAFGLRALNEMTHTAADWGKRLRSQLLAPFFADDPAWPELRQERDVVVRLIDGLVAECQEAGSAATMPFAVLRDALNERASETTRMVARLADGVTVGQLASGQVFPAAVVCAVGMNDGAFPRHPPQQTFDLVNVDEPRLGDRNIRDEDRFAFLEALLAARRCFVVTYTGRDLREDSAIPPSLVVTELQQYLALRFDDGDGQQRPLQHPLQPFSRRYFSASENLYSYSPAMAKAAATLDGISGEAPDRFAGALPVDDTDENDHLPLDELIRFATAPVRHFIERRLGMALGERASELSDEETFELDGLGEWALRNDALALRDAGLEEATAETVLRAKGRLAEGNAGLVQYRFHARQVALLADALNAHAQHLNAPPFEVDLAVGAPRLVGAVGQFLAREDELLVWRVGHLRERDRIEAWLRLLAVCCQTRRAAKALLFGLAEEVQTVELRATPKVGDEALRHWLSAWRRGRRQPLPFFPATSWAWIAEEDGPTAAEEAWRRDGDDEYNRLVFPETPFGADFEQLAERLLGPLRDATS